MSEDFSISFVVPINDEEVCKNNFLSSPLFKSNVNFEIIKQRGFASASKAFNNAIEKANNDIIVFTHQDMFFPDFWEKELKRSLSYLDRIDPAWGVIGCYGHDAHGVGFGYMYCVGNDKFMGRLSETPIPIQTLDEVVLILRKSSGIRFDESLPHYHLYGADVCMTAAKECKQCYAISAFCLHNTNKLAFLPDEFFDCYEYLKNKWFACLPIDTTCMKIEKFRSLNYFKYKYIRKIKHKMMTLYLAKDENGTNHRRHKEPISLFYDLKRRCKLSWDD